MARWEEGARQKPDLDGTPDGRPHKGQDGEQAIVERVALAVMEHRLPPGTKLPENVLCETFGTSRSRVRRALLMLAEREIVELHSYRGAFIASPSPEEARDVFQARRAIEPTVVRNAVERIAAGQLARLKAHVSQEQIASDAGKRHEVIRLSGRFHVRLAEFGGNPVLTRFVEELVARSSLIIGLFGTPRLSSCSEAEHALVLEAIGDRVADRAVELMLGHLRQIESELDLREAPRPVLEVGAILGVIAS
jgi:DNA-binding GntR family transcriptional regulator